MTTLTLTIEVADNHPWANDPGSLVVGDDHAEVVLNPSGEHAWTVSFWQYDEHGRVCDECGETIYSPEGQSPNHATSCSLHPANEVKS